MEKIISKKEDVKDIKDIKEVFEEKISLSILELKEKHNKENLKAVSIIEKFIYDYYDKNKISAIKTKEYQETPSIYGFENLLNKYPEIKNIFEEFIIILNKNFTDFNKLIKQKFNGFKGFSEIKFIGKNKIIIIGNSIDFIPDLMGAHPYSEYGRMGIHKKTNTLEKDIRSSSHSENWHENTRYYFAQIPINISNNKISVYLLSPKTKDGYTIFNTNSDLMNLANTLIQK